MVFQVVRKKAHFAKLQWKYFFSIYVLHDIHKRVAWRCNIRSKTAEEYSCIWSPSSRSEVEGLLEAVANIKLQNRKTLREGFNGEKKSLQKRWKFNDSDYGCCNGNKAANNKNIIASWNNLTREGKTCILLRNVAHWKCSRVTTVFYWHFKNVTKV